MEKLHLRALEMDDIETLFETENDSSLWKYSHRNAPFSKYVLQKYLENQHLDMYEIRQQRFVLSMINSVPVGFVDLYDFEPFHRRAGVGLIILEHYRRKGYALQALELLENYCIRFYNMHQIYANIAAENTESIQLFEKSKFECVGLKKQWNYYDGSFHDEYLYQKIVAS